MQPFHILLIGNAAPVSARLLSTLARQADKVLASDGGAGKALAAGIVPDWVIGDLDSVSKRDLKRLQNRVIHVVSQENTDLEKTLHFIKRKPVTHLTLVGFLGGRWDFSIANILHLIPYAKKMNVSLAGDGWRMNLITHSARFVTRLHKRVSLVPLSKCSGVTLAGLKYPLQQETLPVGTTRSLSNQTAAREFSVQLSRGVLLVYREV